MGKESVVLRDEGDSPRLGRKSGQIEPVEDNFPGRDGNEAGDRLEEGGLTRSRRADDRAKGTGGEVEGDGAEREPAEPDDEGVECEVPGLDVCH